MNIYVGGLILFILLLIVIYLYMLNKASKIILKKKSKKEVYILSVKYLENHFHIPKEKMLTGKKLLLFATIDSLIISFVSCFLIYLSWNIYLRLLLGLFLVFGLIYAVYEILGRFLQKEGR